MLLLVSALFCFAVFAVHTEPVDISHACNDECLELDLDINSNGEVMHHLTLEQRSELRLGSETCRHFAAAPTSGDVASIHECNDKFSGQFMIGRSDVTFHLEWDDPSSSYQLSRETNTLSDRSVSSGQSHVFCDVGEGSSGGDVVMSETSSEERILVDGDPIIEVMVFMDVETLELYGNDKNKAIKSMWDILNDVDTLYEKEFGIRVRFSGIRFIYEHKSTATTIDNYLDEMRALYRTLMQMNGETKVNQIVGAADVVVALTARSLESDKSNTLGRAIIGKMCGESGVAAIKSKHLEENRLLIREALKAIVAHEMGHTLGLGHSHALGNCSCLDCMMYPSTPNYDDPTFSTNLKFSNCSKDVVKARLKNGDLSCLYRKNLFNEESITEETATRNKDIILAFRMIIGTVSGILLVITIILMVRFVILMPEDFFDRLD